MSNVCLSPPAKLGERVYRMGFWGGGTATQKSDIACNREYLARTVKGLDSISIN